MTIWKPDPQTYDQALHEIGCLEQQIADLQEKLAEAHRQIAELTAAKAADMPPNVQVERDAARYRWLIARLQDAYDGSDLEIGDLVVGCSMQYGHRNERCVMGLIRWIDARDEPLNLDAAIDAAMLTTNVEAQG